MVWDFGLEKINMELLTEENVNPYRYYNYDYKAFNKGRTYYYQNRVSLESFDEYSASCLVEGINDTYFVHISGLTQYKVDYSCDCPQAERAIICKHVMASLLFLHNYIITNVQNKWQYRLAKAIESTPKSRKTKKKIADQIVIFILDEYAYTNSRKEFHLTPYRLKVPASSIFREPEITTDSLKLNNLLDKDRSWVTLLKQIVSRMDDRLALNLPQEGVQNINIMLRSGFNYSGVFTFAPYLSYFAKQNVPVFKRNKREQIGELLHWVTEPVTFEAALLRNSDGFSLDAGVRLNGEIYTTAKKNLDVLTTDPLWVLAGHYLAPIENKEVYTLLQELPLKILERDAQEFLEKYLQPLSERMAVQGDIIHWEEVDAEPIPRLYLSDSEGKLQVQLRFGYGPYEAAADPKASELMLLAKPGSWDMARIYRRLEQEQEVFKMLSGARYGLKRASADFPSGTFELRTHTHVLDFLIRSIPLLTRSGFEIYGEEDLKSGRINRAVPRISLSISSGLDWFDIEGTVEFGDQQISIGDLRRALKKKQRFIRLADGSIGQIPEAWLERYKKLFDLAEETEDGLRMQPIQVPLVDELLSDADEHTVAHEFLEKRDRLRNFKQIPPQPIPTGFTGELRPYQKAGLDWLHFLHDFSFGGCLADDMGLGKTIQVLAFLLSLKEQGKMDAPTLLVVPKSLLANWQREAERFTPELRILEYYGNTRSKEASIFDGYDIVLTTYGTMLRDIKYLRSCRFHYAVLDESQAIKNPLAQSSKAARLLQAKHRLVMTGTPVENNTFELWSQFAFINPGLLGSLDYFKQEFASPIESRKNETTAKLLQRLVFPFILRRTKEQVAPELPARTEKILYTDLEPAQRRLYNQTREHYRRQLLGAIESEGMNNARMQILEGLLRLRQICIHPSLVDSAFHSSAAKFDLILETLQTLQTEGHKALVFSQFVQVLSILRKELDVRKIPYTYLDGQTRKRQEKVDEFQQKPNIPFFLISLKAGGVGLNLTAADYVIHIDPWWNPAVEMQAADRAHRIGQDKPVFIYKIIARDSVEEKILRLQVQKRALVDQLITTEGSFFKSITKEDVKVLFS